MLWMTRPFFPFDASRFIFFSSSQSLPFSDPYRFSPKPSLPRRYDSNACLAPPRRRRLAPFYGEEGRTPLASFSPILPTAGHHVSKRDPSTQPERSAPSVPVRPAPPNNPSLTRRTIAKNRIPFPPFSNRFFPRRFPSGCIALFTPPGQAPLRRTQTNSLPLSPPWDRYLLRTWLPTPTCFPSSSSFQSFFFQRWFVL